MNVNIAGKPLVHHSNGLEDQESLETHSFVYLAPPPDHLADPTKNNVVKVMNTVLEDTEEQQKQNVSVKDPHEKLIKFDIVNHIEF